MNGNTIAAIALTVTIIGGTAGAINYFAKDSDLEELAMDFQQERKFNRMDRIEERMWTIKNSYRPETPMCDWREPDREEYRKLEKELRRAREILVK